MHEISLVQGIFSALEDAFSKEDLANMTDIYLQVGMLSNVEPTLMHNAFEAVTLAEEKYQEVKLHVEVIPVEVYCSDCDLNSNIENYKFVCAQCGLPNNNVVKGTELSIHQVHFEEN